MWHVMTTVLVGLSSWVASVGQEPDDSEKPPERVLKSLSDFEHRFLGKAVYFQGDFQSKEIEMNADGLVFRSHTEQSIPKRNLVIQSCTYGSLALGQVITVTRENPPRPNLLPPTPTFAYVKTEQEMSRKIDSTMYGFCFGQRFTELAKSATRSRFSRRGEETTWAISHGEKGIWIEFAVRPDGLLRSVNWEASPGMVLPNGTICPPDVWQTDKAAFEYDTDVPAKLIKVTLAGSGADQVVGSATYKITEKGGLSRPLPKLIDLPGYNLRNGDQVHSIEQPNNHFQYLDGKVLAVVDSKSSNSAQSARWRRATLNSPFYYIGLCGCLGFVVAILLWRRNRA
jgi:hypothetical protein